MGAAQYNITIEQKASFGLAMTWKDSAGVAINVTGYSARLEAKDGAGLSVIDLASGSGITLGGSAGTIVLAITSAATTALTAGRYTYDLIMTSGAGVITRLLEGVVEVLPGVTP